MQIFATTFCFGDYYIKDANLKIGKFHTINICVCHQKANFLYVFQNNL